MNGLDALLKAPKKSKHPVDVGLRSEAAIVERLITQGYNVLLPTGVNRRYDLVIDQDGKFIRCQCKTGRLRDGVVGFKTQSVRSNTKRCAMRSYRGDAELFLVYCPANQKIYVVPVDEAPLTQMFLRVEPTRNGQEDRVQWAKDFELPG